MPSELDQQGHKLNPILDHKKAIHISVSTTTHMDFKVLCMRNGLTIQEVLECCINGFLDEEKFFVTLLEKVKQQKRDKTIKRLSATDADAVYAAIEGKDV